MFRYDARAYGIVGGVFPLFARVSRDEAAAIARAGAKQREWSWSEPETVLPGMWSYTVLRSSYSGGPWAGPVVLISAVSGRVKRAGIAHR